MYFHIYLGVTTVVKNSIASLSIEVIQSKGASVAEWL